MKLKYELLVTIETDDETFDIEKVQDVVAILLSLDRTLTINVSNITRE